MITHPPADTVHAADTWISALTLGGAVDLRSYPPDGEVELLRVTPSGAQVDLRFPAPPSTYTAHVVYGTPTSGYGFQVMPAGSGPLCMAPELDFVVEGPVSYQGGLLVYYRIVRPHHTYPGMTVWQVDGADIVTFDHLSLADAIDNLRLSDIAATPSGVTIRPRDPNFGLRSEAVSVEAGGLHYRISSQVLIPKGPGARGSHGRFYRHNDDVLVFVSDTACAEIQRVESRDPHVAEPADAHAALSFSNLPEGELGRLMGGLSLQWDAGRGGRR